MDLGPVRNREAAQGHCVRDHEAWYPSQREDRVDHRRAGRLQDVETINLGRPSVGHRPAQSLLEDLRREALPLPGGEALGVVQACHRPARVEDHSRNRDGTREGAATDLVHARDQPVPCLELSIKRTVRRRGPHCRS
jgi:hypothetical protein